MCKSLASNPTDNQADKLSSKTYPDAAEGEEVRQGFNPDETETAEDGQMHNTDMPFTVGEDDEEEETKPRDELNHEQPWEDREYGNDNDNGNDDDDDNTSPQPQYASFNEERNVWGSGRD